MNVTAVEKNENFSLWLDVFRWLAAFAVLLAHVNRQVFVNIRDAPKSSIDIPYIAVAGLSSFGAPAVIVFFVLSGFLVGGSSLAKLRSGKFDIYEYASSRLARLWIVIIPVLLISRILLDASAWSTGIDVTAYSPFITKRLDDLVCNALFLQTVLCIPYGHNSPLWSLFQEAWFYVAWPPLMLAVFAKHYSRLKRLTLGLFSVGLLATLSALQTERLLILLYFTIWLLGVVAAARTKPILPITIIPSAALMMASLVIWRLGWKSAEQGENPFREFPLDFIVACAFLQLVSAMKYSNNVWKPPLPRVHRLLAGFSFSLYCIHMPIIHFFIPLIALKDPYLGKPGLPNGSLLYLFYVGLVSLCVISAYLFSILTEKRTYFARDAIFHLIRRDKNAGRS